MWAIYGELNIPIVKTLEANVALRYDDYQDVTDGQTGTPRSPCVGNRPRSCSCAHPRVPDSGRPP